MQPAASLTALHVGILIALCTAMSIALHAPDFPSNPPARATFAVKDLPKGGLVEIEAIAVHN